MKYLKWIALVLVISSMYGFSGAVAMTPATPISHEKSNLDQATGLYGGIKNGKLLLILSDQGKYRYYSLSSNIPLVKNGVATEFSQLPYKTPLIVKTQQGKVIEVTVQEILQ